mmetsp:Transcript_35722/g.93794  ORF Transcript_35722/g.93794 Transcript_35722/m.93794 type:complete len:215 (-) Transcript_35722:487-1131(-)
MIRLRPLRWISLLSTGSSTGSISSSTFSMIIGVPKAMQSSRWLRKRLSVSCVDLIAFFASRDLIQPMPCDCGSIMSGHFFERVTMMPFSTESSSEGSPSRFQSPMVPASTRKSDTPRSSVHGTPLEVQSAAKSFTCRCLRNSALYGPTYVMKAHACATSPASRRISSAKDCDCSSQRERSPARPPMRRLAASIFLRHASASSCSACLVASASLN